MCCNRWRKTNLFMNLLQRFNKTFSPIYVAHQENEPLYQLLEKKCEGQVTLVHKLSDLPTYEDPGKDKKEQKLFVFDDMVGTKNQDYIETMYKRGRKVG